MKISSTLVVFALLLLTLSLAHGSVEMVCYNANAPAGVCTEEIDIAKALLRPELEVEPGTNLRGRKNWNCFDICSAYDSIFAYYFYCTCPGRRRTKEESTNDTAVEASTGGEDHTSSRHLPEGVPAHGRSKTKYDKFVKSMSDGNPCKKWMKEATCEFLPF
jgi:hypothetical protein